MRAIPNVTVIRPADGLETAAAWNYALRNEEGPVALILTRQKIDSIERSADFDMKEVMKGGYVVSKERRSKVDLVIAASGSEVPVAIAAQKNIAKKFLLELSQFHPKKYLKNKVKNIRIVWASADVPVAVVEAATMTGWGDLFRSKFLPIGMTGFGASAPAQILAEKFGFTGEQIAEKIKAWL